MAGTPGFNGAGYLDGTNGNSKFYNPAGLAMDGALNLYVGDTGNNLIRKVSRIGPDWVTSTIAGHTGNTGIHDGTNAVANFYEPQGLTLDAFCNLYVADSWNNAIRKATPIGTNWVVSTIAGNGSSGARDGTNRVATFNYPNAIALDGSSNLYIADFSNSTVRKLTPIGTNWITTTVAGLAGSAGFADGTNSSARFHGPNGIAVDSQGNLYVADYWNCVVRQISPVGTNWVVTTIAGSPGVVGASDGTNGTASFDYAMGVVVDGADNLYVSDFLRVRRLTHQGTNWIVTTLRSPSGERVFNQPNSLTLDKLTGNLYVLDSYNNCIWLAQPAFSLQAVASGSHLTVSWPLGASNYLLETTSTPADANSWSLVASPTGPTNGAFATTLDMIAPVAFYRLREP